MPDVQITIGLRRKARCNTLAPFARAPVALDNGANEIGWLVLQRKYRAWDTSIERGWKTGNCTETGVSSGFCYTQKMIAQPSHLDSGRALELARRVIETEASAVCALAQRLGQNFVDAVELLLGCVGTAVVSGIGKSGHIARKLAATLASTGTPAFFVHPAEAGHGDLGMIGAHDVVLILSNSGETEELLNIIPRVKRLGARLIAMTGRPESNLSKL